MKKQKLIMTILTALALLFVASCDNKLNVLLIPKQGNCFAGKISYSEWTGRGGTTILIDKNSNTIVCEGTYSMVDNALTCAGKKFHAKLACSNGRIADVNFTTTSCTESYGNVVDDIGDEYAIYIGIPEELMKSKVDAYQKDNKIKQKI